jgi:L-2,4-diaminobutyric acid acetyltransferase
LNTQLNRSVMFDRQQHCAGQHETEMLVKVGPFEL